MIAVGMLENMERLKSRGLDGMFEQYLRIRDASSEHRFLRLNTGEGKLSPSVITDSERQYYDCEA